MSDDIVARLRNLFRWELISDLQLRLGRSSSDAALLLKLHPVEYYHQLSNIRCTALDLQDVLYSFWARAHIAAQEIERLRAEVAALKAEDAPRRTIAPNRLRPVREPDDDLPV